MRVDHRERVIHSHRSASIGSTFVARRAGSQQEMVITPTVANKAKPRAVGDLGVAMQSWLAKALVIQLSITHQKCRPGHTLGLLFDKTVTLSHRSAVVLTFIETATFTRLITDLVDDGTYADFQKHLADHPAKGDLLSGCGGVRKIRMALPGRGKSGGAHICYLYLKQNDIIYLLYVFTKGDAGNLSADGKKVMRSLAQQIKAEHT